MSIRDNADAIEGPICQSITLRQDALNWQFCMKPKQGWNGEIKWTDWVVSLALGLAAALLCMLLGAGMSMGLWVSSCVTERKCAGFTCRLGRLRPDAPLPPASIEALLNACCSLWILSRSTGRI